MGLKGWAMGSKGWAMLKGWATLRYTGRISAQETNTGADGIEGLGEGEDTSWGEYPIDTVLIRSEARTVHDVLRRMDQDMYIMNPDFQREFIWDEAKQSKLIESVLMRIPLPVMYLAEDERGRMIVVDGLQRLSTFRRFVRNDLPLRLPGQRELDGKRFADLPPKLQNRVEDCNLILYIIDAKVPERARLDIFERVNSGVPLTRQQMRNSLYMGPATRFLRAEAATELFRLATGESLKSDTMRDREFVNRFCAFRLLRYQDYQDLDTFLAKVLKQMNAMDEAKLCQLSEQFRTSLRNNHCVFGKHAFRKHGPDQENRSVLNASLWEVMSTGLSYYREVVVKERADPLRAGFYRLMEDEEFRRATSHGVNHAISVRTRFERANAMLREVFGDRTD